MTRAIGFGCSSRATADDLLALIRASLHSIPSSTILATLDRRSPIAESVASALNLRVMLFSAATLAAVRGTSTESLASLAATGTPNVAEASALAALGSGACLVVPRQTGRFCTCAVAELPEAQS